MYVLVTYDEERDCYILFSYKYYLNKRAAIKAAKEYKVRLDVELEIIQMVLDEDE